MGAWYENGEGWEGKLRHWVGRWKGPVASHLGNLVWRLPRAPRLVLCGTSSPNGTSEATVGLCPGYLVKLVGMGGTQAPWPLSGYGQAWVFGMSCWGYGTR